MSTQILEFDKKYHPYHRFSRLFLLIPESVTCLRSIASSLTLQFPFLISTLTISHRHFVVQTIALIILQDSLCPDRRHLGHGLDDGFIVGEEANSIDRGPLHRVQLIVAGNTVRQVELHDLIDGKVCKGTVQQSINYVVNRSIFLRGEKTTSLSPLKCLTRPLRLVPWAQISTRRPARISGSMAVAQQSNTRAMVVSRVSASGKTAFGMWRNSWLYVMES